MVCVLCVYRLTIWVWAFTGTTPPPPSRRFVDMRTWMWMGVPPFLAIQCTHGQSFFTLWKKPSSHSWSSGMVDLSRHFFSHPLHSADLHRRKCTSLLLHSRLVR
ncbi:hypothetical protein BDB00DRAFT_798944 [Zychaea mexicana]|uniref:uncharacterized protein n=1 Tax=Zychaea mexicana TaxID=64656 RepID=UPI0022FDCF3D|nr:uncharacterized protein BDB00DRAFT_798944 [Zychaea mexicana]KAI9498653.1 hypothetical protein BDB00DRAFT_798944 [Zychaea mexicana]